MKMSNGVEWAVHCCVVMSRAAGPVPAARLADFHGVSRTYLAKHLQQLAAAGIVEPAQGRSGGYTLTRDGSKITLRDVVEAIEGELPVFRCTEIRRQGPFPASEEACRRPCGVAQAMNNAERAYRDALSATSIADLAARVDRDNGAEALRSASVWLHGG